MYTEGQARYFEEVAIRLKQANYTPLPQEENMMPVRWRGALLCRVTPSGGVGYKESAMKDKTFENARNQVYIIAHTVLEYMAMMESDPRSRLTAWRVTISSWPRSITQSWLGISSITTSERYSNL